MVTKKKTFIEIINEKGWKLQEAPVGKRFIKYPNGQPINLQHCKALLSTGKTVFAASDPGMALIAAHRKGQINLYDYGFEACYRCGGEGKLSHFSHVDNGVCFKCHGYGMI